MKKLLLVLVLLMLPVIALAADAPFTQEMIDRSLVQVGNTERIHRAIDKARRGEDVTIVYLGGSITEGAGAQPQATKCYAYQSAQHFAAQFMQEKHQLKYVNAGISGTPSLLGLMRAEKDVISKKPDVVFIEFAVNDSSDTVSRQVYESLVRKLLSCQSEPAVILLFTLTDTGYSCQAPMSAVGTHYNLGMISVKDAIQPALREGSLQWAHYSSDFAHPTTAGHTFVAELIGHYFAKAAETPAEPYALPEPTRHGDAWQALHNIAPGDAEIETTGSFQVGTSVCYTYRKGWIHRTNAGNDPMVLNVTGSRLVLSYKQENNKNVGRIDIFVDGKLKKTLNGNSTSAWGNIVTEYVFMGADEPHKVEIRMADGDEGKLFTLLDIAVVP